ncbi:uncharacterized protein PgNI_12385 [Pyricularia grisea]|uniref:Uncharacterized protein n=1 Tax=Pyricularia grisea TaxID=148305 RepID=A0A6P8AMX5_PYRGI|nr:uncharacterized protein PgNI_12385 [Pyricularia grisea]TLD03392.1 hypothetical protein PgNI_12385 [Pyricularia grisea]
MNGLTVIAAITGTAHAQTMGGAPQSSGSCVSHALAAGCDITVKIRADNASCVFKHRSAHVATASLLPSRRPANNSTDSASRSTSINSTALGVMNIPIATGASSLPIAMNWTYASTTTGAVIPKPTAGQSFTARLPATAGAASLSSRKLAMFVLCSLCFAVNGLILSLVHICFTILLLPTTHRELFIES